MTDLTPLSYQQLHFLLSAVRSEINRNIEKCINDKRKEKEEYAIINRELETIKEYLVYSDGVYLKGLKTKNVS